MLSLPTLAAAPASAAETATTAIAMQLDKKTVRYADTFTIEGQITATLSSGYKGYVENAPLALQRRFPGRGWATVGRTTSTSYDGTFRFASVKAVQNASYRMVYAGETRTYDGTEVVLQPSTSPERGIRVARNFDLGSVKRNGGIIFNGRVAPSYKGKIVQVVRRKCDRCRWVAYSKVRTNKRSRFSLWVAVPRRGSWDYRVRTAASKAFIASASTRYLSVYRY